MKNCIVFFLLIVCSIAKIEGRYSNIIKGEFPKEAFNIIGDNEAWHPLMRKDQSGNYEQVKRNYEAFIQTGDDDNIKHKSFLGPGTVNDMKQRCQCRFVLDTIGGDNKGNEGNKERQSQFKTEFKITTEKFRLKQKEKETRKLKEENDEVKNSYNINNSNMNKKMLQDYYLNHYVPIIPNSNNNNNLFGNMIPIPQQHPSFIPVLMGPQIPRHNGNYYLQYSPLY